MIDVLTERLLSVKMYLFISLLWLVVTAAADDWAEVVTVTTTQTSYAPWTGIIFQQGDVCYCPVGIDPSKRQMATCTRFRCIDFV
jgi:hypothetical protein